MECLKNIIGLSKTKCECLTDQLPTGSDEIPDYNVSASGVYMDQLPGFNINIASGADDCAKGGIWDRMYQAREQAIQDYKTNLLGCLGTRYKSRINNFHGQLGESSYKGNLSLTSYYAGQKIVPVQIKGAYLTINKIGVLINQSTNVTLYVYSNKNGSTLIYSSTPVAVTANTLSWAQLSTPLELPMWDDNNTQIIYYVLMGLNGTFQPKNNTKSCGCGGGPKEPYLNWLSISGANGNSLSSLSTFKTTAQLNGIVLNVDVKCKVSEIICSDQYPLDFENDVNALSMAYAIRYRADAILYEDLIGSDNINRMTMLNRDQLVRYITEWNDKFMEWINYVCQNTQNISENDCLICKEGQNDVIKRNIVVTGNNGYKY